MVFNSYQFILFFFPVVWVGYQILALANRRQASFFWLTCASFIFYGYWNVSHLPILALSIAVNYGLAQWIVATPVSQAARRRALLVLGLTFNLLLLGYFKYTNFALSNLNALLDFSLDWPEVILPIGISFFTFQQIAFLVDVYRHEPFDDDLGRYATFVSFFPQLIAGPIVHHREMMPQLGAQRRHEILPDLILGMTVFVIGLFKKVVIADGIAGPANAVFDAAAAGQPLTFMDAWAGTLCYAFQIYFDFSGYSDMAIGLCRAFGVALPMNFASPYKALSIVDFWRRWHITLSRFLRDYLYVPLGGNRGRPSRRYANVFVTMVLGGFWHGAGWTFLIWGALHGVFIVISQIRQGRRRARRGDRKADGQSLIRVWRARCLTFLLVALAWVPFRAESLDAMAAVYAGMFALNGIVLPDVGPLAALPIEGLPLIGLSIGELILPAPHLLAWIPLLAAVWLLPNTQEIMGQAAPILPTPGYPATMLDHGGRGAFLWRPNLIWATGISVAFVFCFLKLNDVSEFIYFQF